MNRPPNSTGMMACARHCPTIHLEGKHPRKELLEALGATHADKIYIDKKDGTTVHVGYVVLQNWYTLYHVVPMENPV